MPSSRCSLRAATKSAPWRSCATRTGSRSTRPITPPPRPQHRTLLARDHVVLFEPAIRVGDFFIRIDILVKDGNRFELIEVKAKSYNSEKPELFGARGGIRSDMLPYFQDAAFQTWVLQQAFPDARSRPS